MSGRTWYGLIICLLSLTLLLLLVIPFYADRIQLAIENGIEDRIEQIGNDWTQVKAVGRDVTLSGEAPTPTAYEKVLKAVYSIPGVRTITDLMTQRTISPYATNIDWQNNSLEMGGFFPDEDSVKHIKRLVNKTYTQNTQQIKVGHGNPEGWTDLVKLILDNVQHFENASVDLIDKKLSLSGKIPSSERAAQFKQALIPFEKQGYKLNMHVIALDEKIKGCQDKLNRLMQTPIGFALGQSALNPESFAFLEQLTEAAMFCPDDKLILAGHTDNTGNETKNKELSLQRANRVADWLVQAGIDAERISTKGFGSQKPVADNETKEGRSQNRRIEFIVGGK